MIGTAGKTSASSMSAKARYALAAVACTAVTLATVPFSDTLDQANAVMMFLLVVFLVSLKLGRGPAVFSAVFGVALFDFFYVPPHFTFVVSDGLYLITLAVMLAVGLITTRLTASLQEETKQVARHERETEDLYELGRKLTGAATLIQVEEAMQAYLSIRQCRGQLFLLSPERKLETGTASADELACLAQAFENSECVHGQGAVAGVQYLPLVAPMCVRGVLAIYPLSTLKQYLAGKPEQFATLASLLAIAIERLHYVEVASRTELQISAEKLRSSLLSALSHDLRTPLTALVGLADTLAQTEELTDSARANALLIRGQAQAMFQLLTNLLDMARLQSGKVVLRRDWQLFEDVISAALHLLRPALGERPILVRQTPDLPLVEFDAVLIERVLCNLIENAAKYSPADQPIEIRTWLDEPYACLEVCDHGPGFPADRIEQLFELFERGEAESNKPGVGLGLGICKAIAEAHGGKITAINRPQGGACVVLRLPLGTPPQVEDEVEHV